MGAINARQVLEKVMAESLGLPEYEYINYLPDRCFKEYGLSKKI